MKPDCEDDLLRAALAGDTGDQFRQASLEHMLGAVRRRRRRRAVLIAAVPLALIGIAALLASRRPQIPNTDEPALKPVAGARVAPTLLAAAAPAAPAATTALPRVKEISDEQLFALFPERAVALIGPAGRQTLMFLDAPAPGKTPAANE